MEPRNTCYLCEDCGGCFKHWECQGKLCKGNFDTTCKGTPRKHKTGMKMEKDFEDDKERKDI